MAATPAIAVLERARIPHTVHRYPHHGAGRSFGDDAVDAMVTALGVVPGQVFKTLVISGPDILATAVIPVPAHLSMKATARALGVPRVAMADPAVVTRATGYVLGGVSPLGQRNRLATVVDVSAQQWPTVLCSAGRRGMEIQLSPADLISLCAATTADLTV
ncbi:aminoacyl-tRNA deacylase [Williamsia sterculiae]|uniref:Cys-tRNA(Pro)/Cys-tRNA(Cys) deacylase n=1 Tax=Williamsia sterculiae TaxID=1344003 RepID=A0A1N7FZC8_9NOCA|nr:aminoacyl-tRNA deacylase [Williamsia sterculiae]SIS05546.1 Cys-tRNA(Pro)/Cys-tRNA(Cys) deacylase [Williamsia sterculiae]